MELIHTCYRITDPDRSIAFYRALGFEERRRMPIRDEAMNIYMGLPGDDDRLELTYNYGVDSYELGTGVRPHRGHGRRHRRHARAPAGPGHPAGAPPYTVSEGGSRLCFVRDPDGYRIELIERGYAHRLQRRCRFLGDAVRLWEVSSHLHGGTPCSTCSRSSSAADTSGVGCS